MNNLTTFLRVATICSTLVSSFSLYAKISVDKDLHEKTNVCDRGELPSISVVNNIGNYSVISNEHRSSDTFLSTQPFAAEIRISGKSIEILDGDTTPNAIDDTNFGSVNIGESLIRTFTIQNFGNSNLTISNISISGTNFTVTGLPYSNSITSGSSTSFNVTFNSQTLGVKTATVTITSNDPNTSNFDFTIQASNEQNFFDSDGDGIFDNVDIDDDNDGIRDSEEERNCKNSTFSIVTEYKFLNESFGSGNRTTIDTAYDAFSSYCYEDGTASCTSLGGHDLNDGEYTVYYKACDADGVNDTPNGEVASWADAYWYAGEDHTPGDTNGRMAMFNAALDPGIFYTANISGALPNVPITYSFWALNLDTINAPCLEGCPGGPSYNDAPRLSPNILVEFRDLNNNLLASITTGDIPASVNGNPDASWHNFTADLTFGVTEFNVIFINNQLGGIGNDLAIDDIVISQTLCDTDNDSVADIFDLDSDNDGIPDVVEAGFGNLSNGKGRIDSWLDANLNGMHDALENSLPLDSDSDGTPNYIDLDSDNDAIFDVDESGAGNMTNTLYQNGDGDIDGDGVGDGPDSDSVRLKDFDSDGITETFTDGILDIYDYHNGATLTNAYGNSNQGSVGLGWHYYTKDSDNDGFPDYMDTTSDGVTFDISHTLYADLDTNNDGLIDDTYDAEGDGIVDLWDTDDVAFGSPRDLNRKLHLYFDGRNDYAEDSEILSGRTNVSLMGWIKIDPTFTNQTGKLFGQDNFEIEVENYSDMILKARANGITVQSSPVSFPIVPNRWYHVATTFNGSTGKINLYLNGENINSETDAGLSLNTNTYNFTIGKSANTGLADDSFKGYIDEVRVFNKTLSDNEIHKMVYQEIEDNSGTIRGRIIPRDITDFINPTTINPLNWNSLIRYYRMDVYKGNIIDDLTTPLLDVDAGAKIFNVKLIDYQTAPMPFITQASGNLPDSVNIPSDGVHGNDAVTYDWSIVQVNHNNVSFDDHQYHLGLLIEELDSNSNPIKYAVTDDSELNISWYLKLNGFIDLEGESQLVQNLDSDLLVGPAGRIEKDQQGTRDLFTYNYWSAPVGNTATSNPNNYSYTLNNNIMKDGTSSGSPSNITYVGGYNGSNGDSGVRIAHYWIWKFNNRLTDDYASWQHVRNTGSILAGEGFTMKGVANTSGSVTLEQNYVFDGKPNNGDVTLPINNGNEYLVGNPYASAIDAEQFITDNGPTISGAGANPLISGTLYFWEHWGGGSHVLAEYQGGYGTYNFSGGSPAVSMGINDPDVGTGGTPTKTPGRYIPVGQGFFVAGEANGNVTFNNGQRIFQKEGGSASVFMRSTETNTDVVDSRMKIRLGFNSVNNLHRQLLVTADSRASVDYDWGFDALLNEVQMDDMSWLINTDKYTIQGVDVFEESTILPLAIKTDDDGLNSITIDALENISDDLNIFVHDIALDIYHNLRTDGDYEIYLTAGEYVDRFELTFTDSTSLSTEDFVNQDILNVYFANTKGSIIIHNPKMILLDAAEMFNMLGQSVIRINKLEDTNYQEIKVNGLSTGTYIINLEKNDGSLITKKVIVN